MLNLDEVPDNVLEALSERFEEEKIGETAFFKRVSSLSAREAFEEFCQWHGLIGWSHTLWEVVKNLEKAEVK